MKIIHYHSLLFIRVLSGGRAAAESEWARRLDAREPRGPAARLADPSQQRRSNNLGPIPSPSSAHVFHKRQWWWVFTSAVEFLFFSRNEPRAVRTLRQVGAPRQNSPVASFLEKLNKSVRTRSTWCPGRSRETTKIEKFVKN